MTNSMQSRRAVFVAASLLFASVIVTSVHVPAAHASTGGQWIVVAPRLSSPTAIAADAAGNVYALEAGIQSVIRISPSGVLTLLGSGITTPDALFVSNNGDVYVSDDATGAIDEITPNGTQSTVTTAPSTSPIPELAVSSSDGEIWFAQEGSSIFKSAPGGTPTAVPLSGAGGDSALTADNSGNVYAQAGHFVDEVAPDGTVTQIPDPPRFGSNGVWGLIRSDANGDLWQYAGTTWGLIYAVGISSISYPLKSGVVWNVTPSGDVVEAGTSFVDFIDMTLKTTYLPMDALSGGLGLVTAPDGNVQVGQGQCQVEIDAGGTEHPDPAQFPTYQFACDGTSTFFDGPVSGGGATAADPYLQHYFTIDSRVPSNQQVAEFSEEPGGFLSETDFGGAPSQGELYPYVASNGTDHAWFVTSLGGGTLLKIAYPSGTLTNLGAISNVSALAVDGVGNVYAAVNNYDLERIPAGGGTPTVLSTSLQNAEGLTFDAGGNLWIADAGHNQVLEDVSGSISQIGDALPSPSSIAFDAAGDAYALSELGVEELVNTGSPSRANQVAVLPGDQQLAVSWHPPTSLGTGSLVSYTVRVYSRGLGIGATCTTTSLSCVVTNANTSGHYSDHGSFLDNNLDVNVEVLTQTTAGVSETPPIETAPIQSSASVLALPAKNGAGLMWYSAYSASSATQPTAYVVTPYLETSSGFVAEKATTFARGSVPVPARVGKYQLLGPVAVGGLLPGHIYVLSVAEKNRASTSTNSKDSGWVDPVSTTPSGKAPSAPTHLKVTFQPGTDSFVASWAKPSTAGSSAIQYYCVQPIATTGADANAVCVLASSRTVTINRYAAGTYTGFRPGTYHVVVYAVNKTKTGKLSSKVTVSIASKR
jgi:hypothetical protein